MKLCSLIECSKCSVEVHVLLDGVSGVSGDSSTLKVCSEIECVRIIECSKCSVGVHVLLDGVSGDSSTLKVCSEIE